jgi:geranylgeranyl pyrophosphate synthase
MLDAVDQLSRPITDILRRGGKGWRGYTLAICCRMVGGDFSQHEDWLAFAELLHVGSLIVDDVEDNSVLRRGGPACHLVYGPAVAINTGTLAYFAVQRLIEDARVSDATKLAIYREYVSLLRLAHIGQGLDLELTIGGASPNDLSDIAMVDIEQRVRSCHRLKSGVPFKQFARIGARLGSGSDEDIDLLGGYFLELGTAFQLVDELLDVTGFIQGGKTLGEDLHNGKWTVPIARLMRATAPDQRRALVEELRRARDDDGALREILARISGLDIVNICKREVRATMRTALGELQGRFTKQESLDLLREFSEQVLEKHY